MIIPTHQPTHRTLTISQVAHCWASGQLAHAWGNEAFQEFSPDQPLCYAAEQHDIGFARWENEPTLNGETGLPHTFEELPEKLHFDIWRIGIAELRSVSHYASLIVSLHFCHLCESFHPAGLNEAGSPAAQFLQEQRAYQDQARTILRKEMGAEENPARESFHRKLIGTWDYLSLELCRDRFLEFLIPGVPTNPVETTTIQVRYLDHSCRLIEIDPWPFRAKALTIFCGGRILTDRYTNALALQRALQEAEPVSIAFNVVPRPQ